MGACGYLRVAAVKYRYVDESSRRKVGKSGTSHVTGVTSLGCPWCDALREGSFPVSPAVQSNALSCKAAGRAAKSEQVSQQVLS